MISDIEGKRKSEMELRFAAKVFNEKLTIVVTTRGQITLVRVSKDKRMLSRVQSIIGAGNIHSHYVGPVNKRGGKSYRLDITKAEECVRVMDLLWRWLSKERQDKWKEAYARYDSIRKEKKEILHMKRVKEIDVKPEFVVEEEEKKSMLELENLMREASEEKKK